MKKSLAFCMVALFLSLTGCTDRAVTPDQLPESITSFIQQNFPGTNLTYAESERCLTGKTYDIVLSDGTRIDFDTSGEWDKIEGTVTNPVPTHFIPETIVAHIQGQFPDAMILKVDKEKNGYEVELANGLELKYDKKGVFTAMGD